MNPEALILWALAEWWENDDYLHKDPLKDPLKEDPIEGNALDGLEEEYDTKDSI